MDRNSITVSPILPHAQPSSPGTSRLSSTSTVKEQQMHARNAAPSTQQPATKLHRSSWALLLVFIYITLSLFYWIAICKAVNVSHQAIAAAYSFRSSEVVDLTAIRQRYEAARIIQSFVAIITIPLTSAICSNAAVIFTQQKSGSTRLTLRQMLVLADQSWSNPSKWPRIAGRWTSYGSSFILGTTILTILGITISPLQQAFLKTKTVRIPVDSAEEVRLFDMATVQHQEQKGYQDDNILSIILRNALGTADTLKPQAQLWEDKYLPCANDNSISDHCYRAGDAARSNLRNDFNNMSNLYQPFFSELPNSFNTGLHRQFALRVNSTAKYEVTPTFPAGCDQLPGAFFANYADIIATSGLSEPWAIKVCMPADHRTSPWRPTRDRQDFSETLYLNITYYSSGYGPKTPDTTFKITVNTTAGYFELPNYSNGGAPGPLLPKDPLKACGDACAEQIPFGPKSRRDTITHERFRRQVLSYPSDSSASLESVFDKGPLLATTMALFGTGSFISARLLNPSAYKGSVVNRSEDHLPSNYSTCADFVPMSGLLKHRSGSSRRCIVYGDGGPEGRYVSQYLNEWVGAFAAARDEEARDLSNAFTVAAFLANQAWVASNKQGFTPYEMRVSADNGDAHNLPWMSNIAMFVLSALLGIQLFALLLLAVYSTYAPRWIDTLDGFAMMRIGAALAEKTPLPLSVGREASKIPMLDKHPGWVGGSAVVGEAEVVQLGLGGPSPLNRESIYASYAGDSDLPERLAAVRQREKTAEFRAITERRMAERRMAVMEQEARERV